MEVRHLRAWCFMNTGLLYVDFCRINRPRSIECNQTGCTECDQTGLQAALGHSRGIAAYPSDMT